jgi:hypothetical protein
MRQSVVIGSPAITKTLQKQSSTAYTTALKGESPVSRHLELAYAMKLRLLSGKRRKAAGLKKFPSARRLIGMTLKRRIMR